MLSTIHLKNDMTIKIGRGARILGSHNFFGVMKNEMFYGHEQEFQTFEQLKEAIAEYIDYYNNRRIKGKTKWMPPVKFREASMLAL